MTSLKISHIVPSNVVQYPHVSRRLLFVVLASILFLLSSIWTVSAAEVRKWPHEQSTIQPDPTLIYGSLENGLRYVLKKNSRPEKRVSIMLNVQVGSIHEKENERGMAHYLEHMLFNGSTHFKPNELVKFFQRIGMSFGPDANAHTGFDETVYKILLPENDTDLISEGLLVMRDYADGALLLESEVEREKGVILSEKLSRDSSGFRTTLAELGFLYSGSHLAERFPIGVEETIKGTTAASLRQFYEKWYRADNMVLVIVGDIEPNKVIPLIEKQFASMTAGTVNQKDVTIGKIAPREDSAFYHFESEAGKVSIGIGTTQNIQDEIDSIDVRKEQLTAYLGEIAFGLRLNEEISKTGAPFTNAGYGSGKFLGRFAYAGLDVETSPEKWESALLKAEQMMRQVLNYGFNDAEIDVAKREYRAYLRNNALSESTRKSSHISSSLIRDINKHRVSISPSQKEEMYLELLDQISVADVNKIMKKPWDGQPVLLTVSGNLDLNHVKTSPEKQIMSVYQKSLAVAVNKPVAAAAVQFPYLDAPEKKGVVAHQTKDKDLDITSVTFENHVRLNLKKTDFDKDKIFAVIAFGNGRYGAPKDKPGISEVTEAVLDESGFGQTSIDELKRVLAGKTTTMSIGVESNRFQIKGKTVPGEEALFFQLAYHQLLDPGFRQNIYDNYISRKAQDYERYRHKVEGIYQLSVEKFLAGGDYRFGLPPYAALKAVSIVDIQNWILPEMRTAPLEISIVGDFDEQQMIDLAAQYFGSLPERKPLIPYEFTESIRFPDGERFAENIKTDIPKSLVNVVYPSTDSQNIGEVRKLNMLSKLFSERLRIRIREKLGESYSPFAYNRSSSTYKDYGLISAFIYTSPENTDLVAKEVKLIAADIVQNGLSDDEMMRIKNPTITTIKDQLRTNGYWLHTVLTGSSIRPEQLSWAKNIESDYESITTADIQQMAKKYLINDKAATIIIKPMKK